MADGIFLLKFIKFRGFIYVRAVLVCLVEDMYLSCKLKYSVSWMMLRMDRGFGCLDAKLTPFPTNKERRLSCMGEQPNFKIF
jgi:hypothetical protein